MKHNITMQTEAIAHQGKSLLFIELASLIGEARKTPKAEAKSNLLTKLGMAEVITRHTGLKTTVNLEMAGFVNAWITPPYLDANHPVVDDLRRNDGWIESHVAEESNKFFGQKGQAIGSVDLEKSRLGGAFTKLECPITVTKGLLFHDKFSNEAIAAVILHEIGHAFTAFEFLGRIMTFNGALQAASEQFLRANTRTDKLLVIQDTDKAFGVKTEDPELMAATKDKDVFQLAYARTYLLDRKSSLDSHIYDITLWESLADQFAMRHGAGKEAIFAIYEISKSVFSASYQSYLTHIIFTVIKIALFCLVLFGGALVLLPLIFINPAKKIYDDPKARMQRMRNDLVAGLKDDRMDKEYRKGVVDDLKQIDELLKTVNDKRGVIEMFYTAVLPSGRRQYSQRAFQMEMERLTSNNLLVAAARLDTANI